MKNKLSNIDWKLVFILILPVLFYAVVRVLTTYSPHSICLFKLFTGHECWGCGITRAFAALFQLNFKQAYTYNPRIIIIAPLMIYIWLETLIKYIKHKNINTLSKVTNK